MFKRLTGLWPALLAGALLLGCSASAARVAATGDAQGCLAKAPAAPASASKVTVRRVVDGDTIELQDGTKVRLIGMNTPESVDPRRPVQAFGKEASAHMKEWLEGKEILLKEGRAPRDKYGRTLAWLWLPDGGFINAMLVRDGYAQVYTFSDNPDNADLLLACQKEAREANRGLWALSEYHDGEQAAQMDRQPAALAPAGSGVTITKAPGTVAKGATASVSVKTAPGVTCSITVTYKSGPSSAQGLSPKQTDGQGGATWSWTIGKSTASGTWPVTITCGGNQATTQVTVP